MMNEFFEALLNGAGWAFGFVVAMIALGVRAHVVTKKHGGEE